MDAFARFHMTKRARMNLWPILGLPSLLVGLLAFPGILWAQQGDGATSHRPEHLGSLHRAAGALGGLADAHRRLLIDLNTALAYAIEDIVEAQAMPDEAPPKKARAVWQRLAADLNARLDPSGLGALARAYHLEMLDGLEALAYLTRNDGLLAACKKIASASQATHALSSRILDLFSRERPVSAQVWTPSSLLDALFVALSELQAAERAIVDGQRGGKVLGEGLAAYYRLEASLGRVLDLVAGAAELGIEIGFSVGRSTEGLAEILDDFELRIQTLQNLIEHMEHRPYDAGFGPLQGAWQADLKGAAAASKIGVVLAWPAASGKKPNASTKKNTLPSWVGVRIESQPDKAHMEALLLEADRCNGADPTTRASRLRQPADVSGNAPVSKTVSKTVSRIGPKRDDEEAWNVVLVQRWSVLPQGDADAQALEESQLRFQHWHSRKADAQTAMRYRWRPVTSFGVFGKASQKSLPGFRASYGPGMPYAEHRPWDGDDIYRSVDKVVVRFALPGLGQALHEDVPPQNMIIERQTNRKDPSVWHTVLEINSDRIMLDEDIAPWMAKMIDHPGVLALKTGVRYRVIALAAKKDGSLKATPACHASKWLQSEPPEAWSLAQAGSGWLQTPNKYIQARVAMWADDYVAQMQAWHAAQQNLEGLLGWRRAWQAQPREVKMRQYSFWQQAALAKSEIPTPNATSWGLHDVHQEWLHGKIWLLGDPTLAEDIDLYWSFLTPAAQKSAQDAWIASWDATIRNQIQAMLPQSSDFKAWVEAPSRVRAWWLGQDPIAQRQHFAKMLRNGPPKAPKQWLQAWSSLPLDMAMHATWPDIESLDAARMHDVLKNPSTPVPQEVQRDLLAQIEWQKMSLADKKKVVEDEVWLPLRWCSQLRYALRSRDRALGFYLPILSLGSFWLWILWLWAFRARKRNKT